MNLLVTGAWADAKAHISELEAMGHTVCFVQYEKDKLPCEYAWVEGVICNGLFLGHPIERFTNSKLYSYLEKEETKVWQYSAFMLAELFNEERSGRLTLPEV